MKPTSTTPRCVGVSLRERHTQSHNSIIAERKPKSVILLRSSQLEFPLLQYYIFTWETVQRTDLLELTVHGADGWMC